MSFNIFRFIIDPSNICRWDDNPAAIVTDNGVTRCINGPGAVNLIIDEISSAIKYFVKNRDMITISKIIGPSKDRTELVYMEPMIYRRCTVFPVIQYNYSTRRVRITVWGSDNKGHLAQGTDLSSVERKNIVEHIESRLGRYHLSDGNADNKLHSSDYYLFVNQ